MSILDECTPKEVTVEYHRTEQPRQFASIKIGISETWVMGKEHGVDEVIEVEKILQEEIAQTVDNSIDKKLKELK